MIGYKDAIVSVAHIEIEYVSFYSFLVIFNG